MKKDTRKRGCGCKVFKGKGELSWLVGIAPCARPSHVERAMALVAENVRSGTAPSLAAAKRTVRRISLR